MDAVLFLNRLRPAGTFRPLDRQKLDHEALDGNGSGKNDGCLPNKRSC